MPNLKPRIENMVAGKIEKNQESSPTSVTAVKGAPTLKSCIPQRGWRISRRFADGIVYKGRVHDVVRCPYTTSRYRIAVIYEDGDYEMQYSDVFFTESGGKLERRSQSITMSHTSKDVFFGPTQRQTLYRHPPSYERPAICLPTSEKKSLKTLFETRFTCEFQDRTKNLLLDLKNILQQYHNLRSSWRNWTILPPKSPCYTFQIVFLILMSPGGSDKSVRRLVQAFLTKFPSPQHVPANPKLAYMMCAKKIIFGHSKAMFMLAIVKRV